MSNLNLLIIAHYFPPVPGVGGRRWAKFVKYLTQEEDVNVHVVSAENTVTEIESSFSKDLVNLNFVHTTLPSNYPKHLVALEFKQKTFYRKIMFKLQLGMLKRKVKGNYWDFSVFWETHFENKIPQIIEDSKIDKIIVSGPPYRYIMYALNLRKRFPHLEIILDYRDPWNDANDPAPILPERHDFERALEKEALQQVDKIITVSEFQKAQILSNVSKSAPIFVVPNGFDPEDQEKESIQLQDNKSDKIKLVHFGTLHLLKEYYWKPFLSAYARLKKEAPVLYDKIEINLVGYIPEQVAKFIEEKEIAVIVHGILDPFLAYEVLHQADIALWFKYDRSAGDFATKFGDYIANRKFIWTFSVEGTVTDYIMKEKIGKVFFRNDQTMERSIFNAFLELEDVSSRVFNPEYDATYLQIDNLTHDLIKVLRIQK